MRQSLLLNTMGPEKSTVFLISFLDMLQQPGGQKFHDIQGQILASGFEILFKCGNFIFEIIMLFQVGFDVRVIEHFKVMLFACKMHGCVHPQLLEQFAEGLPVLFFDHGVIEVVNHFDQQLMLFVDNLDIHIETVVPFDEGHGNLQNDRVEHVEKVSIVNNRNA